MGRWVRAGHVTDNGEARKLGWHGMKCGATTESDFCQCLPQEEKEIVSCLLLVVHFLAKPRYFVVQVQSIEG